MLALVGITASAQFEADKKYLGASLNGLDLSYDNHKKFALNLGFNGGYMVEDDMLIIGTTNFDFYDSELRSFELGGKLRYFFEENGIFIGAGASFVSLKHYYDDFKLTAEVGYCYFLNKNLTIQPRLYYDLGFSESGRRLGLAVELGWFF